MVGGVVIEAAERDGQIFVDCKSRTYNDTCAIWVEKDENSVQIRIGDNIWWQGNYAYWTPLDGSRSDVWIKRVGFSGVKLDRSTAEE